MKIDVIVSYLVEASAFIRSSTEQITILICRAGLFKDGVRQPRVSAKFEFRYESLSSKIG